MHASPRSSSNAPGHRPPQTRLHSSSGKSAGRSRPHPDHAARPPHGRFCSHRDRYAGVGAPGLKRSARSVPPRNERSVTRERAALRVPRACRGRTATSMPCAATATLVDDRIRLAVRVPPASAHRSSLVLSRPREPKEGSPDSVDELLAGGARSRRDRDLPVWRTVTPDRAGSATAGHGTTAVLIASRLPTVPIASWTS